MYAISLASVQPVLPKLPDVLQVNAPTYVIFLASVQSVILKYLCLDCFDLVSSRSLQSSNPSGLATPIFSLSSLEPKSLRMFILTIILVQVLCCLYQSPKHYIEIWHERPFSLQSPPFWWLMTTQSKQARWIARIWNWYQFEKLETT